jgi:glycosyltransferase involved in cell wall biosynthesis
MKVLWFSNTPANADEYFDAEIKGSGGWLKALDKALQDHVELHVAFNKAHDTNFRFGNTYYYPINLGNGIKRKILSRFFNYVPDMEYLDKYLKIINEVKPDIIHVHGTENAFGIIVQHTDIPVVISIQGNITVYHHKYFSGFEKRYVKIKQRSFSSIKDFLFPRSFYMNYKSFIKIQRREERNLKHAKFIIGRTEWDRRISRILAPSSEYFVGHEMLRDSFYKSKWQVPDREKFIIHTTNGNNYYKGFETLCLSLSLLNNLGFNFEWRVAGIHRNDLIVKLAKKKLGNRFPQRGLKFLGNLNEHELVNCLVEANIFVMVSHIENSPNNLCEAMILGMPCISTFVGGVGSLMKDGKDGILVQSGDPWALSGAILEYYHDPDKAKKFGLSAYNTSSHRHNKEIIVQDLIATYNTIIENAKQVS